MRADSRDPRSIVTPEAFELDPGLLGLPLAAPSRRLAAIGIDFALVGVLTALLSNVQLLLWGGIALVLVRLAFKKSGRTMSQAAGVLMRTSAGCLGVAILSGVLIAWGVSRMSENDRETTLGKVIERGTELASPDLQRDLTDTDYRNATTPDEALRIMRRAAARMAEAPLAVRRQILKASVPPQAAWAPLADSLIAIALSSPRGAPAPGTGQGLDSADARSVAALSDAEVLAALGEAERTPSPDEARDRALRSRATEILAADTLDALDREVSNIQDQLEAEKEARAAAEKELSESRTGVGAFAGLIRDMWKQLGSAVGLWSLYFTVLTSIWRGQTIGKRLMRVRVLRLDGQPIGWWSAFERAGGYVAGVATGLLGFAQVLWDPNRQCIHDKIVGTVVVADGAPRVEGAWVKKTIS